MMHRSNKQSNNKNSRNSFGLRQKLRPSVNNKAYATPSPTRQDKAM